MQRRDFIKYSVLGGTLAGLGLRPPLTQAAHVSNPRTLVNIMLLGGADLRYLFAPNSNLNSTVDPDYATKYGEARLPLFNYKLADTDPTYANYGEAWTGLYQTPDDASLGFGIHHKAPWLLA